MIYLSILAAIVLALTWILACLLIPAGAAFALVWISVSIFTLSVLIFFAGMAFLSNLMRNEKGGSISLLYPLGCYVGFCFLAIFISLALTTYSGLAILHLFGILFVCTAAFVMRSAWNRSTQFAAEHKADQMIAVNRSETLNEICSTLKMLQNPELASSVSTVHLFAERLRYAPGAVNAACDAELDAMIEELSSLATNNANPDELQHKLPILLQKMENQLTKRERLAVL